MKTVDPSWKEHHKIVLSPKMVRNFEISYFEINKIRNVNDISKRQRFEMSTISGPALVL